MSPSNEASYPDLGGAYRIVDVIGEGGMGTVYLAEDLRHDRRVAVKTIRRDLVTPEVSRRFEREIRVTSRLQHPRILPLLDSGVADGSLFYVMQFVEGESLEARLEREGPLPLPEAARIARHIADALAYAHGRDVVHRDIKPANVLLSEGHAFVMDFGIARAVTEASSSLTGTGSSIGTPSYMSPEQIGDATTVDGRSDIYSLGCVLYEMVVGQPPFVGPSVDSVLRQHLASDPPSLAVYRPGAPPRLEAIVHRALQKSPADRFQTAREVVEALRELSGTAPREAPSKTLRTALLVVAGYLLGAWGVLAIVERVAENAALPAWTVPFALVLMLIGLLVTGATAFVQTLGRRGGTRAGGTDPGATGAGRTGSGARGRRLRKFFRWRNAAAGGVLALALWGLVAALLIWRQPARGGRAAELDAADSSVAGASRGPGPADSAPSRSQEDSGPAGAEALEGGDRVVAEGPPRRPDTSAGAAGPGRDDRTAIEPVDSTAIVAVARQDADLARTEAVSRGARAAPTPGLDRADSLWAAGLRAQTGGQPTDAAAAFEGAREAYGEAGREAGRILTGRLDSARSHLDSLREAADREHEAYADGQTLRAEGRDLEAGGDPVGALATLGRARDAYVRAMPAVAPPDDEAAEPDPPSRTPEERIERAMTALEDAFEAEDVAAIERIWVNLTTDEVQSFSDFFESSRELDYRYTLEPDRIRETPAGIEFVVSVWWVYQVESDDRIDRPAPFEQRFRLEATAEGDVLVGL